MALIVCFWPISSSLLSNCSAMKSFQDTCPCDKFGTRIIDNLRYFFSLLAYCLGSFWSVAYTASHDESVPQSQKACVFGDISARFPEEVVPIAAPGNRQTGFATAARRWFDVPGLRLVDKRSLPAVAISSIWRDVLVLGLYYVVSTSFLTVRLKVDGGPAFLLYLCTGVFYLRRRGAQWQRETGSSNNPASPVIRYLCIVMLCTAVQSIVSKVLESNPSAANTVITLYPLCASLYEALFIRYVGAATNTWAAEDASVLARLCVVVVEGIRTGLLLAAAAFHGGTNPFEGPFFKSLLTSVVSDVLVRNGLVETFLHKIRCHDDVQIARTRPRFLVVYMSAKVDTGYFPWILVLLIMISNSVPSVNMVDCDMKPYHVYNPPIGFVVVGILGEMVTDVLAVLVRRVIQRFRPLWVVPLFHVACHGTVLVRVLHWVGLLTNTLIVMSGAAMVLDLVEL